MATTNMFPVSIENGRVHSTNQPSLVVVDDANQSKWMAQFIHGSEERLHFCLPIPLNYVSGGTLRLRWRSASVTGTCYWRCIYRVIANAGALTTISATDVYPFSSITVSGSANDWNESTVDISSGLVAGATLHIVIDRADTFGGGTMTGVAEVPEWSVEWVVDSSVAKCYRWIPPKAFTLPTGTGCTIGAPHVASDFNALIYPHAIAFPDAAGGKVHYSFALPSNFAGNLLITPWVATGNNNGAMKFSINAAKIGVGDSIDPVLTAQTSWSISAGGSDTLYHDLQRPCIVSPGANDTVVLEWVRDNSDANSDVVYGYGLLLEWDSLTKNPNHLSLDPGSWALPPSSPMAISKWAGANWSAIVLEAADGVDLSAHTLRMLSSLYVNGGTFKVRWSSPASSGNGYFRVDHSSPASGTSSDPAQTAGTPTAFATLGANLMNELSVDISAGIAASDIIETVLVRLGSDVLDTLGNTVRFYNSYIAVND